MPISFILFGLILIYLAFYNPFTSRLFYLVFGGIFLSGFFMPLVNIGSFYINIILFILPLIFVFVKLFTLSLRENLVLFIMVFATLLVYVLTVRIQPNFALTISELGFVLILIGSFVVSYQILFPYIIFTINSMYFISIFYNNPNRISVTLGSVECFNFIATIFTVLMIIKIGFKKTGEMRDEKNI